MKKFLDIIAYKEDSDIPDDDGQVYRSREDHSYVGRVGVEDTGLLKFLKERGVSRVLSNGGTVACLGFSKTEKKWYGWSH